ncbi:MAG TPA: EGF domain-containing protein [Polyangiales bacterium]
MSARLCSTPALWLALACAALAFGCRKPQEDGPLRARPDASVEDAGAIVASSCDQLICVAPAQCAVSDGKAACSCPSGWSGDPNNCQDIDECALASSDDCGDNATCQNTIGSFTCSCNDGFYQGPDGHCTASQDCDPEASGCHIDAHCTVNQDVVRCACNDGFEGDGYVCRDQDECQNGSATCADHATCVNRRGGYDCVCDPQYQGDGRSSCQNACDAALADRTRCDAHARCHFGSDAAASCDSCLPGYLGDGKTCSASEECARLACDDNSVCSGPPGGRSCQCAPGFHDDGHGKCIDSDECADGSAGCDASTSDCANTPGGFVCTCKTGYERKDGACVNVDECAEGLALCDREATCTDQTPSAAQATGYTCACNAGFEGDGYACVDIDECNAGLDDCGQGGLAQCQNTRGSFQCVCPKGYAGDAKGDGCYCDLSGYWGAREDTTLTLPERTVGDVVLIASSVTRATVWELDRFRYDGTTISIEHQPCGADVAAEIYSPQYEEVYSSSVPNSVYDTFSLQMTAGVPMSKADALPNKSFVTPRAATLEGITLNDPLNDKWPATFKDVPSDAWVDVDKDSEPGMTFWPGQTTQPTRMGNGETYSYLPVALQPNSTLIATRVGCVSTAIRSIGHLEGKIESCGRLTGKVFTEKTEGRVHSCTVLRMSDWDTLDVTCTAKDWSDARRCSDDQVAFLDGQDQTTQVSANFELVKLADLDATDIDCPAVRQALPAILRQ